MTKLNFYEVNRDIFEAICDGRKKIETRAAAQKFLDIKEGDIIELVCGKDTIIKQVKKVESFKTISDLLKKYKVQEINPVLKTSKELEEMYYSFPNYKEKIEKFGIIVFELI